MTWQPEERAIVAQRAIVRSKALTIPCSHCGAQPGEECVSSKGVVLVHQPAHYRRLQEVGL